MANVAQAIRLALHYAEEHYDLAAIFGEDVGPPLGGVFTVTQGLRTAWNSPLDERGIIGYATGMAMAGKRVVCEIQFVDYIFNSIDLLKLAANKHWASNGQFQLPMVVMTPSGAGIHGGLYHSHSMDSIMAKIAGFKIVYPSNPLDAYGLILSAILDPNPVMYFIPKALVRARGDELIPGEPEDEAELKRRIDAPIGNRTGWKPDWPETREHLVPIGKALIKRAGTELTVVSYARALAVCLEAAEALSKEGLEIEVIDLRSLYPYDYETITKSVYKTRNLAIVNEDTEVANFGEHIIRRVTEDYFHELKTAPKLIAAAHVPGTGLAEPLEHATVPMTDTVIEKLHLQILESRKSLPQKMEIR